MRRRTPARSGSPRRRPRPPRLRATRAYLDVACELVEIPDGAHRVVRVVLSFNDWASGGRLLAHSDFTSRSGALDDVACAVAMFGLRKTPGRERWQSAPSPGLRRAVGRVAGRLRRGAAGSSSTRDSRTGRGGPR